VLLFGPPALNISALTIPKKAHTFVLKITEEIMTGSRKEKEKVTNVASTDKN